MVVGCSVSVGSVVVVGGAVVVGAVVVGAVVDVGVGLLLELVGVDVDRLVDVVTGELVGGVVTAVGVVSAGAGGAKVPPTDDLAGSGVSVTSDRDGGERTAVTSAGTSRTGNSCVRSDRCSGTGGDSTETDRASGATSVAMPPTPSAAVPRVARQSAAKPTGRAACAR